MFYVQHLITLEILKCKVNILLATQYSTIQHRDIIIKYIYKIWRKVDAIR